MKSKKLHLHLPCNHPRAPSALQMPPAALAAPLAASAGHGWAADAGPRIDGSHRAPTKVVLKALEFQC